jgi:tRNA (cytidine56-2'-O)-methyltransferase
MTEADKSIKETITKVGMIWGGETDFNIEIVQDWKKVIHSWKNNSGKVIHLTMYGINIDDAIGEIRKEKKILVVIGAQKVPREVYILADYNVAIGNQPHSEIGALSIFLDRFFRGEELKKNFRGGKLRIIPNRKGKNVKETNDTRLTQ